MKRFIVPFILLIVTLFTYSCSEKFKIGAPYKNITVVYGYLDKADTAHYIRIQKAYLDDNKSSISLAKEADSNFFSSLNVRIEKIGFSSSAVVDTIHLNRVDLNMEGYPKQPGVFFDAPNYAYKFKSTLDRNYIYRLKVTNLITGEVDSADAPIIEDVDPTKFIVEALDTAHPTPFDFSSRASNAFFQVYGQSSTPIGFKYLSSDGRELNNPAYVEQVIIRFNWDDSNVVTHERTPQYYDFRAADISGITNGVLDCRIFNTNIHAALASVSGLGIAPANTVRLMNRCDFTVYLSTYEYYSYQQAALIQGTGLTGSEIQPIYTNLRGENVIGLFTSRGMRTGKVTLTPKTIDSLMNSPFYAQALVKGTTYH